jgi:hypothetical protein
VRNRFPIKDEELDDLLKESERYAKYMLKKTGSVPPTLLALTPRGFLLYVPKHAFDGAEDKDKFAQSSRLIAIAHRATAVSLILESWATFAKEDGQLEMAPPSQSPDREEVVSIMVESHASQLQRVLLIQRSADGKFAGFAPSPLPDFTDFSGRFAELMPPGEASKENVEMAKMLLKTMGVKLTCEGFDPRWN